MKIIYDDLVEFSEVKIRCENTRDAGYCEHCPLYNSCEIDDFANTATMKCDILDLRSDEE